MSEFFRATEVEPSEQELMALFNRSTQDHWLFDEETNIFTFKENMNLFVVPDDKGGFKLMYGYMKLTNLSDRDLENHLPSIEPPLNYA